VSNINRLLITLHVFHIHIPNSKELFNKTKVILAY